MRRRWCCYHLKLEPIFRFARGLEKPVGQILGLRRAEATSIRPKRKYLKEVMLEDFKYVKWKYNYCPILEWSDGDVASYIREHGLPEPPWYRLGVKETCVCGAFSNVRQMARVRANWPEFFEKFLRIEERYTRSRSGAMFFFENRPYYAKEFLKQKLLTDYLRGHT